ncbi:MAG TPA: glycosyltransferase family 2 protein [Blastocatellia bacterium]|nr:glycosyltransferase family 2 protein [Blastocatellia bacterium]
MDTVEAPDETSSLAEKPRSLSLDSSAPEISVFLPVYNEAANIIPLSRSLEESLDALGRSYEIVYVDDGSTDGSLDLLRGLAERDPRIRVISLRRNYGQTAALSAGIDHARGRILVPMDADLQNDPVDIGRLLDKLEEGYDVVSGWRRERKDRWLTRRLPSAIANRLISRVSRVPLHDFGCTLKAYRRHVLEDVKLYGEMHRLIPIYASWAGARVAEIPVTHHSRISGKSNYGLTRAVKVVFDLLTIKFLSSYLTKPLYLFGTAGLVCLAVSVVSMLLALYYRFFCGVHLNRMPAATLAMILFAMGFQFILMGLLAEMVVRTYHESQNKPTYSVRERINMDDEGSAS